MAKKEIITKITRRNQNLQNFHCKDPTVWEGAISTEKFTELKKILLTAAAFTSLPIYKFPSPEHSNCICKDTATDQKDGSEVDSGFETIFQLLSQCRKIFRITPSSSWENTLCDIERALRIGAFVHLLNRAWI